jgi:hypothetical protein
LFGNCFRYGFSEPITIRRNSHRLPGNNLLRVLQYPYGKWC